MNAGVVACALALALFLVFGIVFAALKGKAAIIVSGFNSLTKRERAQYDTDVLAKDMRNACFLWTAIMAIGCFLSYALTPYLAIVAYAVWLVLLFKGVHVDASTAFEKYRKQ